jgi:hypothetical protein
VACAGQNGSPESPEKSDGSQSGFRDLLMITNLAEVRSVILNSMIGLLGLTGRVSASTISKGPADPNEFPTQTTRIAMANFMFLTWNKVEQGTD